MQPKLSAPERFAAEGIETERLLARLEARDGLLVEWIEGRAPASPISARSGCAASSVGRSASVARIVPCPVATIRAIRLCSATTSIVIVVATARDEECTADDGDRDPRKYAHVR